MTKEVMQMLSPTITRWALAAFILWSAAVPDAARAQEAPPPPPSQIPGPMGDPAQFQRFLDSLGPPPDAAPEMEPEFEPEMGVETDAGEPGEFSDDRLSQNAVIQFDPETGSLIVISDDATNLYIEQVIRSLDRPVPQVLIKVLFLEVTYTDKQDLGVEGLIRRELGDTSHLLSSAFGLAAETRGGFYRLITSDVEVLVRALAENNKLEVLSRPSVLARNNWPAVITVGQEVPFITNTRVTELGGVLNTIDYRDIGIILRVTPRVLPDRMVEMDVFPEISKLTAESVPLSETVNAVVIAKRSAETRVVVADGNTVVIGGMMEDSKTESIRKIPLLGDIPFFGALFRRKVTEEGKTELLIFLTPYIVERSAELRAVSQDEFGRALVSQGAFGANRLDNFIDNLQD